MDDPLFSFLGQRVKDYFSPVNRYKKKVVLLEEAKSYILPLDLSLREKNLLERLEREPPELFSFAAIFGNDRPVEVEVGFGTGKFLLAHGSKFPDRNLLGLEITHKMVHHAANQLFKAALSNVRVIHCDGRVVLRYLVPKNSVERVHVYFPDPWVKKRHIKRRVANRNFLETVHGALKPGGHFNLFTDHRDYFDYFMDEWREAGLFTAEGEAGHYAPTPYEQKWVREGRTIYRIVLRKGNP